MLSCKEKSNQLQGKLKEGMNSVCWRCAEESGFHHSMVKALKNKEVSDCVLCNIKTENT